MSKRAPQISVLTANRLTDGTVVFLAPDGDWVEGIEGAAIAQTAEEASALQAQGERDAAGNLVVEPYLAAVAGPGARPLPARMRERVRVDGPSILADVPGYVSPSPRATPTSPRAPTARGEGRGEGQPRATPPQGLDPDGGHVPSAGSVAAPYPSPLPARGERGLVATAPEAA